MFKNFVVSGIRNLRRNTFFSLINIFGLSISLAICLLIISITIDQHSYDEFHPLGKDTYRINTVAIRKNGGTEPYATTPLMLGKMLESENSFVKNTVQLHRIFNGPMSVVERKIMVNGHFTEPAFFEVFGFTLKSGTAATLNDPRSIILSEETASKFFGNENPIGKSVLVGSYGEFQVTGVVKKAQMKTHIEFDILGSSQFLKTWQDGKALTHEAWKDYYSTYTYIVLNPGVSPEVLQSALDVIPDRIYKGMELETRDAGYRFEIQPMSEITPGPILSNGSSNGMPRAILIFLMILAGIGMFAALFNYTNLTLARSTTRAKEVGIRKVSGASRSQLIFQFIGESVVISFISLLFAEILLRVVLIPSFQSLGFAAFLNIKFDPSTGLYLFFVLFTIFVGILAGLIPSITLSSFAPAVVIKDPSRIRILSGLTLRKTIIIVEFVVTTVLLIILTTIYRQSEFATSMNYYGFDWHNTINVQLSGPNARTIAEEMARFPGVNSYSFASHAMGTWADQAMDVKIDPTKDATVIRDYSVDEKFINDMKLTVVAGEGFRFSDKEQEQIIINEKFLSLMNLKEPAEAIGKIIYIDDKFKPVTIIGVIKDFVFKPVTYELEPMILRYVPAQWAVVHFKVSEKDFTSAKSYFESVWKKFNPSLELNCQLYSQELNSTYGIIEDLKRVIGLLSGIVLVIAILGLLGAASYNVETKTREIGIRKVLGASAWQLAKMLSLQYIRLIALALLISVPLSLFLSEQILSTFAYHTEFGLSLAVPAVLFIMSLVLMTIGSQILKGIYSNPVSALRQE